MPLRKSSIKNGAKPVTDEIQPFYPTAFQSEVLVRIAPNGTTLISAPTGSGKTEAAILPALNWYLESRKRTNPFEPSSGVWILVVCPLKALVDDLTARLEKIVAKNCPPGLSPPEVTKLTGDTPAGKRQFFRKKPTPILVTTPETLARLLAHPDRQFFLQTTQTVIVDEWHSLAATKRGADLSLTLARLSVLCPVSPKRIGLSATVANPQFLACQLAESPKEIQVLTSRDRKNSFIEIHSISPSRSWLDEATKFLKVLCLPQGSKINPLLVFVQTRSLAERLAHQFSKVEQNLKVVLHHGSLSESVRRSALIEIHSGYPDIIISTASLELGMDIGSVRTVILLDPPGEVVRMIQRIGRSGRGPNQKPKGILLIRHPNDLLEAGLSAALGMENWLEPIGHMIPHPPLDLLCQHLLGEAIAKPFPKTDALKWLNLSPYFPSPQEDLFNTALGFLDGGSPSGPGRIPPRLREVEGTIQVVSNRVTRMVLQSLGTIQADPLIPVHLDIPKENTPLGNPLKKDHQITNTCIGHIDETYAETIKPGDRFLLAGKVWERTGGDFQYILAKEHEGTPRQLTWPGNRPPKSTPLCAQLYSFRALAKEKLLLGANTLAEWLRREMPINQADAGHIVDWLEQQERKSEIPDTSSILVESVSTNGGQSSDYDIHLPLPACLCSKLGQFFQFRIKSILFEKPLTGISTVATNMGLRILDSENALLKISIQASQTPVQLLQLCFSQKNWLPDLRSALFGSDHHRRKFQESAHLSLMISPPSHNLIQRTRVGGRDWPARRLFDRVISTNPLLLPMAQATNELISVPETQSLETWFDNQNQMIWKSRDLTSTSPFARTWNLPSTQAGDYQNQDDPTLVSLLEALGDA